MASAGDSKAARLQVQVQTDRQFQDAALPGVSRTFAFTIPQLPESLRPTVTNAYLLCRLADTIEDHADLAPAEKQAFYRRLLEALTSEPAADALAQDLYRQLPERTPESERELARNAARVLRVTRNLPADHQDAIARCLGTLSTGMARFQAIARPDGLADRALFDEYCYHVAGVVGELLTRLFIGYSPAIARHGPELMSLAVSFGQGLQMTNILKDIWEDRAEGVCWLPRDVFDECGYPLAADADWAADPRFHAGLGRLIGDAHGHLHDALRYTQLIPAAEPGIRRFCAWAIGMALLTLRRLDARRNFRSATEVKISRAAVRGVIAACNVAVRHDGLLAAGFRLVARGLPRAQHQESGNAVKVCAGSGNAPRT